MASLPAWGQTANFMSCAASSSAAPIRAGGGAERVSDVLVTCTGGTPTAANGLVQPVTFTLTLNATVTSRVLAQGWSEALLVVDEPGPSSQLACSTADGNCTITGTGTGKGTYSGVGGRPNVFQGAISGGNAITWRIPLDPPGSGNTRVLRFTNLRTVADVVPGAAISANVSASGQLPFTLTNPTVAVGSVQAGFTSSVSSIQSVDGRLVQFTINAAEGFTGAFKPQSSAGPQLNTQAGPGGAPLDFELGFYNPSLQGSIRGALSSAGVANSGTRIRVRLNSIPTQATVTLPLTIPMGATGLARLVATDAAGAGFYTPATNTTATGGGTIIAIYEIVQASSVTAETLSIPVTLSYSASAPLFPALDADVALAPQNTSTVADNLSPIPRFVQSQAVRIAEQLRLTTPPLLSGQVGVAYTQTIRATGGGLPYTFSAPAALLPPGLTLSSGGLLSGTPTTAGTYRFTATVSDGQQGSANATYSVTIFAASPVQTSERSLDFTAPQSGNRPPARTVLVSSSQPAQSFAVTVDAGAANTPQPAWIRVSPMAGTTPASLTVSTDPGDLPPGIYTARILVSLAGNPNLSTATVVTLTVTAAAPALDALPALLKLDSRVGAPGQRSAFILVRNTGGGGLLKFSASVAQGSRWITGVTPTSGQAGPRSLALLRVDVDSTGLAQGNYRDLIRITSDAGTVEVPVVLRVFPNGPLLDVQRSGLRFSTRQGSAPAQTRDVRVLNRDPNSILQWTAEIIRGADNFALSQSLGSASFANPGVFRVSVRPGAGSLPIGAYPGIIRVSSPGSPTPPRYISVVLNVRAASDPPQLDLDPGGIVLTGIARSATSVSRTVALNANSNLSQPYQAAASSSDGGTWLSVSPGSGNVSSAATESLTIQANPSSLSSGIYTGQVTVSIAGDSETLNVTLILTDAASEAIPSSARTAICAPGQLVVSSTGLPSNFTVPAGWPATLSVDVRDNCGSLVTNATVVARFSNGDPPLPLVQEGSTGTYSATWQPRSAGAQTNVTVDALTGALGAASVTMVGSVAANAVPKLYRNGTIHNLDPKLGGLLSPGLVVQIYGEGLASVAESTGSVPLSTNYKGTSVLVGAYEAPLYYVSPGQLVAQLPSELAPNNSYPILVVANGQVTIPDEVDVVAVQPGVAQFPDGTLIAQHSDFQLVTAGNPAKRNEFLIMYLVGLGATNPAVASGFPSPGTLPLGVPVTLPTVTIGGINAEIGFAGLTPFGVGLYQINFRVPQTAPAGTPLQVVVKQGEAASNTTTLTVAP